jgi:hypothetical protein
MVASNFARRLKEMDFVTIKKVNIGMGDLNFCAGWLYIVEHQRLYRNYPTARNSTTVLLTQHFYPQ